MDPQTIEGLKALAFFLFIIGVAATAMSFRPPVDLRPPSQKPDIGRPKPKEKSL